MGEQGAIKHRLFGMDAEIQAMDGNLLVAKLFGLSKKSRHSGRDRRNPDCRDANNPRHPYVGAGS